MSTGGGRNWVFTRQVTDLEKEQLQLLLEDMDKEDIFKFQEKSDLIKYIIFQLEEAPTTGQWHLQGFVNLSQSRKMSYIKKIIGNNPHVERAHDVAASIEYCKKESTRLYGPWEYGNVKLVGAGKRTDLISLYDQVKKHKRTFDMLEADPSIARLEKPLKFMKFIVDENRSDRTHTDIKVIVLWGDTNLGKTWSAVKYLAWEEDYFILNCTAVKDGNMWFDGYEGQTTLILDDFDQRVCSVAFLKNLLDKYKMRLPIKGSHTWAAWTKVVITSNEPPKQWWLALDQVQVDALKRRITEIRHYQHLPECDRRSPSCLCQGLYKKQDWDMNDLDQDYHNQDTDLQDSIDLTQDIMAI